MVWRNRKGRIPRGIWSGFWQGRKSPELTGQSGAVVMSPQPLHPGPPSTWWRPPPRGCDVLHLFVVSEDALPGASLRCREQPGKGRNRPFEQWYTTVRKLYDLKPATFPSYFFKGQGHGDPLPVIGDITIFEEDRRALESGFGAGRGALTAVTGIYNPGDGRTAGRGGPDAHGDPLESGGSWHQRLRCGS